LLTRTGIYNPGASLGLQHVPEEASTPESIAGSRDRRPNRLVERVEYPEEPNPQCDRLPDALIDHFQLTAQQIGHHPHQRTGPRRSLPVRVRSFAKR
jgi:hypothetical protein